MGGAGDLSQGRGGLVLPAQDVGSVPASEVKTAFSKS